MKKLSAEQFQTLLTHTAIKPRIKRDVRFAAATAHMDDDRWQETELLAVPDKSGNKGVLVIGDDAQYYLVGYELSRGITSSTGKAQPIVCDFCRTWQTGSRSGSILFSKDRSSKAVGVLCCADLDCSRHVRSLTAAAKTSRSQLREDLTTEQRVARLRQRLQAIAERLELEPLAL